MFKFNTKPLSKKDTEWAEAIAKDYIENPKKYFDKEKYERDSSAYKTREK